MSNNKDTGMRLLRNKITNTFSLFELSKIKSLSRRVVDRNVETFTEEYGNVRFFLHSGIDGKVVKSFLQFYDPGLR